ncbi:MAG: hypothetical protein ACK56F_19790, partial [bacterium]
QAVRKAPEAVAGPGRQDLGAGKQQCQAEGQLHDSRCSKPDGSYAFTRIRGPNLCFGHQEGCQLRCPEQQS